MALETVASPEHALAAELGAALPARRSAVELAAHYGGAAALRRALQELQGAQARYEAMASAPQDHGAALARLALPEAAALEAEAAKIEDRLLPGQLDKPGAALDVVASLQWEARYGEGRARAYLSARLKRVRLPGFDDALELEPEEELLFLALRRFTKLLHAGAAWPPADLDWLALRAATVPGRLRLHAAVLRSAAEDLAKLPLPEALVELRRPFIQFGYDPAPALAWGVAGLSVAEALAWGSAGLAWPVQALAWRAWGFSPKEAAHWYAAQLMPDEAAAFRACGAKDPETARQLRKALGDVENLLAWHRAGFGSAEILKYRAEGVRQPEAALRLVRSAAKAVAEPPKAMAAPEPPKAKEAEPGRQPAAAAPSQTEVVRSKDRPAPIGIDAAEGGACLGWGVVEEAAIEALAFDDDGCTRPLGVWRGSFVRDSECVAVATAAASRPQLNEEPQWQAALDRHRAALGLTPSTGAWCLTAVAPRQARLFWGLYFRSSTSPWGRSIDFDASETWQQRWKRKTEEFGEAGQGLPCEVGRSQAGGWFMAARGSERVLEAGQTLTLDTVEAQEDWSLAVDRFCLVMGLGRPAQGWQLLAESA